MVHRIIEKLAVHAAVEEQAFYPAIRSCSDEVEKTVLESLEEHHIVKWTLSELDDMDPGDERFDPKVTVLMESVRHDVEEEEGELFPEVQRCMEREQLDELGTALEKARKAAPTRPHPRAPDTPPGNVAAGAAAGVTDRARDAARRLKKKAASARPSKSRS